MDTSHLDPSKFYLVSGKTLAGIQDRMDALWGGDNIQRGPGIFRRGSGTGGFSLAARGVNQAVPASPQVSNIPFGISTRADPGDPTGNTFQAMVNLASDILQSLKPNDNLAVTGLGAWFPLIATDVIALWIPVSSYAPVSATIQSYGLGTTTFDPTLAAWSSGDNSYVFDDGMTPPSQIGINILLAYSTPDPTGKPFLIQCQLNHVLLELGFIEGEPALYDWSHRRRYGITYPGP